MACNLKKCLTAFVGLGERERRMAVQMKEKGYDVIAGVRPGRSWDAASHAGIDVYCIEDAVKAANIIYISFSSEVLAAVWDRFILPSLADGHAHCVIFASPAWFCSENPALPQGTVCCAALCAGERVYIGCGSPDSACEDDMPPAAVVFDDLTETCATAAAFFRAAGYDSGSVCGLPLRFLSGAEILLRTSLYDLAYGTVRNAAAGICGSEKFTECGLLGAGLVSEAFSMALRSLSDAVRDSCEDETVYLLNSCGASGCAGNDLDTCGAACREAGEAADSLCVNAELPQRMRIQYNI